MQPWPDDLFGFAWFPDINARLQQLAEEAENEDWSYHHTPSEYPLGAESQARC